MIDNPTPAQRMEEMAWEPFEGYPGKELYQWISQLAWDIENKKFPMEND